MVFSVPRAIGHEWKDDPTIRGTEILLRRIPKTWVRLDSNGNLRITSAAFKDRELSILIASVMSASGRQPRDAISGYLGYGLVSITAADARSLNQLVARDPTPDEAAHEVVVGPKHTNKRRVARKLRDLAQWIVKPQVPYI